MSDGDPFGGDTSGGGNSNNAGSDFGSSGRLLSDSIASPNFSELATLEDTTSESAQAAQGPKDNIMSLLQPVMTPNITPQPQQVGSSSSSGGGSSSGASSAMGIIGSLMSLL